MADFFGEDPEAFLVEIALGETLTSASTSCVFFVGDPETGPMVAIVSFDSCTKAGATGFDLRGLSFMENNRNLRRGLRGLAVVLLSPLREEKNRLCMLFGECVCRPVCNDVDYTVDKLRLCHNKKKNVKSRERPFRGHHVVSQDVGLLLPW